MKRILAIVAILALALSACAPGESIGSDEFDEISDKIDPTASPDKPRPRRDGPRTSTEPSPQQTQPDEPTYKPNTYIVAIRGTNNFYEFKAPDGPWRQADTGGPVLYEGDILIFKNMDSRPSWHSFTSGVPSEASFGKAFDSGQVEPGKQWKWVVDAAPGDYKYSDANVQYYTGYGPMRVVGRG